MTDFTKCTPEELSRVTTRDGRKVRILCTDANPRWPIVGLEEGFDYPRSWKSNGLWREEPRETDKLDLILPPAERVVWLRSYSSGAIYASSNPPALPEAPGESTYTATLGPNPKIERV